MAGLIQAATQAVKAVWLGPALGNQHHAQNKRRDDKDGAP